MSPRCDLNPPMINFHIFIMFIVLDIVCTATKNLIWITYFYYNSNGSGCPNSIYGCASPKSSNSELKLKKTIKLAKCCCIIFAILWYPLQRSTPLKPLDRSLWYYINMAYRCLQFKFVFLGVLNAIFQVIRAVKNEKKFKIMILH